MIGIAQDCLARGKDPNLDAEIRKFTQLETKHPMIGGVIVGTTSFKGLKELSEDAKRTLTMLSNTSEEHRTLYEKVVDKLVGPCAYTQPDSNLVSLARRDDDGREALQNGLGELPPKVDREGNAHISAGY